MRPNCKAAPMVDCVRSVFASYRMFWPARCIVGIGLDADGDQPRQACASSQREGSLPNAREPFSEPDPADVPALGEPAAAELEPQLRLRVPNSAPHAAAASPLINACTVNIQRDSPLHRDAWRRP